MLVCLNAPPSFGQNRQDCVVSYSTVGGICQVSARSCPAKLNSQLDFLGRRYICDRAIDLRGYTARHSSLLHQSHLPAAESDGPEYYGVGTIRTLVHRQIAAVAKYNSIRVLPFPVIADGAFGVFYGHVRGWLRYPLGLQC